MNSNGGSCVRAGVAIGLLGLFWLSSSLKAEEPNVSPPGPFAAVRADEYRKVEEAIPAKASVTPSKPRKLLVFELNVDYPGPRAVYPDHATRFGHRAIAHANLAFTLMGRKTGAFDTVVSRDPAVFEPESLRQFDAICFNNTVGDLFRDADLRRSLLDFVYSGGGLMGIHASTVAFTNWKTGQETWPEFAQMLGARGANHSVGIEHITIQLDDPDHPVNRVFGNCGFEYSSEFFRYHTVYSRDRVRVLLSIDTHKSNMDEQQLAKSRCQRADNDYALAWVRNYGRGRVFHSTLGHNPSIFWDPKLLVFYLDAIQFAFGDLPAPTTPSGRLTPATRVQEKLGWRLSLAAHAGKCTLFDAAEKAAKLGLSYLDGDRFQKVSDEISKNFDFRLGDEELQQIRRKLDLVSVRLLTYDPHQIPSNEADCRKLFEFGRKMGIETLVGEAPPQALDTIERLCNEYDIRVALDRCGPKGSPAAEHPNKVLKLCQGRGKRIGICGDLGCWMRAGIDPIEAVKTLQGRLLAVRVHDLHERAGTGRDVTWGTGAGHIDQVLATVHSLGIQPTSFSLQYSCDASDALPEVIPCMECFNKTSLQLAH